MAVVVCFNKKCECYKDEVDKTDETNCCIKMWDEVPYCKEFVNKGQADEN